MKAILQQQPPDSNRVKLLIELSTIYRQSSQDSSWSFGEAARKLAEQLHYETGLADAFVNLGILHRIRGSYTQAMEELLKASAIYEKLHATASLADSYLELAQLYKNMSGANNTEEYLDRAISYSKQAYGLYNSIRDTAGLANSLNQAGICYRDKGKTYGRLTYYDTAYIQYTKALGLISNGSVGQENLGRLYNNISQVYSEYHHDYKKALEYLFRAVAFNNSRNSLSGLSFNYGNISNAYSKLGDHRQALLYARKMLEAGQQLKQPERIQNAYGGLYRSFLAAGKTDSALYYYVLADKLDDSLTNLDKNRQVLDLQTKYETGKKESEIVRLQTESHDNNKRIAYLLTGIILLTLLAGSLIWLYQRVRKQRRQIAGQSARLEVMMKELHHRVKNNLQIVSSLLSLQTHKLTDAGAINVLKESQLRVQAMSFIHQRLYKTDLLTAVNMREYLTDLAESLVSSYGYHRDQFDLRISVEKELLDIDKALPTGLIINEMVTNSLKYAYGAVSRPSLTISLKEENGNIVITVKDNGPGIDAEAWKQKGHSFGKQLITALCRQLRAQQQLVVDGGTAFTITIPAQAA